MTLQYNLQIMSKEITQIVSTNKFGIYLMSYFLLSNLPLFLLFVVGFLIYFCTTKTSLIMFTQI